MKKSLWIRIPALIMAVFMLLSTVGCDILLEDIMVDLSTDTADSPNTDMPDSSYKDTDVPPAGTDSVSPSETYTEIATQAPADTEGPENLTGIKPNNYACEFTILVGNEQFPVDSLVSEEQDGPLLTAAYERALRIREHLGVELQYVIDQEFATYTQKIIAAVKSGADEYQLVLTHPNFGVAEFINADVLYDIGALESVNLDKPYWATDMMDEIKVHDQYLLGYQDLCLMAADVVLFDKTLAAEWNRDFLYEDVLNEVWTLERFMELSAGMFQDMDGDGMRSEYDMYGICIWDRENLNSFLPASDIRVVASDENGKYSVEPLMNNDKLFMLADRIMELYTSMDVHAYTPSQESNQTYPNATALLYLCNTAMLGRLKKKEIDFGILPYPKWDTDQDGYRSRSRNGFMCVPLSIANPDMVGDVLELMGYYATDVKDAYYEQLLGVRTADAPDDTRMLDIIWESQVTDMGYVLRQSSTQLDQLVSILAVTCERGHGVASTIKANLSPAQKYLDKLLRQ